MGENSSDRYGMRPAQVLAAALAAITAAFLGSRLGVYGTVIGAGLVSLLTTIGGEFYLRSLDRTKRAASGVFARQEGVLADEEAVLADEEAVLAAEEGERRTPRWVVVTGASVAAFALGMAAVTGIEALSGSSLSGGEGKTVTNMLRGDEDPGQTPADMQKPVADEKSSTEAPPTSTPAATSEPSTETPSTTPTEPSETTSPTDPPVTSEPEPEPTDEPEPTGVLPRD